MSIRAACGARPAPPFGDGVEMVRHPDLTETFDWRPLLDGVDTVIHLAGLERSRCCAARRFTMLVNHQATARLAERSGACRYSSFHFCLLALGAERARCRSRADRTRCIAAPSMRKAARSLPPRSACALRGVPFTILRPVPVYGPGMSGGLAFLLRAAVSPSAAAGPRFHQPAILSRHRQFSLRLELRRRDAAGERRSLSGRRSGNSAEYGRPDHGDTARRGPPRAACCRRRCNMPRCRCACCGSAICGIAIAATCASIRGKLIAAGWHPVYDTRTGIAKADAKFRRRLAPRHAACRIVSA